MAGRPVPLEKVTMVTYKRLIGEDKNLNIAHHEIGKAMGEITSGTILDNVIIKDIQILAGGVRKSVAHGLGRDPQGAIIIKKAAPQVNVNVEFNGSVLVLYTVQMPNTVSLLVF